MHLNKLSINVIKRAFKARALYWPAIRCTSAIKRVMLKCSGSHFLLFIMSKTKFDFKIRFLSFVSVSEISQVGFHSLDHPSLRGELQSEPEVLLVKQRVYLMSCAL